MKAVRGALVLLAALAPALLAQTPGVPARGRVVHGTGAAARPVPGTRVVLHRIGREAQGPLDSALTDADGRFAFRFPADTASLYILTARFQGIEYFSDPLHTNPRTPDTAVVLTVYDTSTTAPVHTEARHIVISKPGADGTRTVVELIVIGNPGQETRVAPDSTSATWHELIPRGAIGFSAEDGDLSASAVDRNMDSVLVLAPLSPGQRQISIQYQLPGTLGLARFPFEERINGVNVLVEEPDARVSGGGLRLGDSVTVIQGRPFRRFSGTVNAGDVVEVRVPVPFRLSSRWLYALVGLLGAALLLALGRVLRGSRAAPAEPDGEISVDALLGRLAAMDERLAGLAAAAPERSALLAERQHAKDALAAALARTGRGV